MWHFKTRLGTFWVVEEDIMSESQENTKYHLGIDDFELGIYDELEQAAQDVRLQSTGHPEWDSLNMIKAPENINAWKHGEPDNWAN